MIMSEHEENREEQRLSACAVCGRYGFPKDDFCFGCGKTVCPACEPGTNPPFGDHQLEDHTGPTYEGD
jgi:hypothetical protein